MPYYVVQEQFDYSTLWRVFTNPSIGPGTEECSRKEVRHNGHHID